SPLLIAARYQWPYSEPPGFSSALLQHKYDQRLKQQPDAVKILIEKGADPNTRDNAGRNALMVMSMEPDLDEDLETATDARREITASPGGGRSDKIVEMTGATLLDAGCDVNASDNKGRTPLIYAVAFERPAVIELLLKRGANISAKDHNGESALDWAMKSGNQEIIKLLPSLLSSSGVKT